MKYLCLVFFCFLICLPLAYPADSSANELADSLKGKVVFLRGMEPGDKLSFDAQGAGLESDSLAQGAFSYSAIEISGYHLSDTALEFTASRCALMFGTSSKSPSTNDIRFIRRSEPVSITINRDASHPKALSAAIRKIFALTLEDALSGKSSDEVQGDMETIGSIAPEDKWPSGGDKKAGIFRPGAGVPPPRVLHSVQPSNQPVTPMPHKKEKFEGACILNFIVDTNGRPIHIRVARSLNSELDTRAVEAVSQYLFAPPISRGKPVPVRLDMELNFHIF